MKTINYRKLWILLIQKNITKPEFRRKCNISTGTMTKLNKNHEVALSVLLKICDVLECDISDICETTTIID